MAARTRERGRARAVRAARFAEVTARHIERWRNVMHVERGRRVAAIEQHHVAAGIGLFDRVAIGCGIGNVCVGEITREVERAARGRNRPDEGCEASVKQRTIDPHR
jgi:hypothetical protein